MKVRIMFSFATAFVAVPLAVHAVTVKSNLIGGGGVSHSTDMFTQAQGYTNQPNNVIGDYWSDGLAPHSDADYSGAIYSPAYVGNPSTKVHTFVGKSLAPSHFSLYCYSPNEMTFENDGLILGPGSDLRDRTVSAGTTSRTYIFNGKLTITGTSSNPAKIHATTTDTNVRQMIYKFTGDVQGDSAAYLQIWTCYNNVSRPIYPRVCFSGSLTNYQGTLNVRNDSSAGVAGYMFDNTGICPGKVVINKPSELTAAGQTVGFDSLSLSGSSPTSFDISGGTQVSLDKLTGAGSLAVSTRINPSDGVTGHLTVTDFSTYSGTLSVAVGYNNNYTPEGLFKTDRRTPVLTVPSSYADSVSVTMNDTFPTNGMDYKTFGPLGIEFTIVTETIDGMTTFYLTWTKAVAQLQGMNNGTSDLMTKAGYWNDDQIINDGGVYWSKWGLGFTPYNVNQATPVNLPNTELVLTGDMNMRCERMIFKTVNFVAHNPATDIVGWANNNRTTATVNGFTTPGSGISIIEAERINIVGPADNLDTAVGFRQYEKRTTAVAGPVYGSGTIMLRPRGFASTYTRNMEGGWIYFDDLAHFKGTIRSGIYTAWKEEGGPLSLTNGLKLVVKDANGIGGERDSFLWKSVRLGQYNSLYPYVDVTLGPEKKRGLYIDGVGGFFTPEGKTLTLTLPVTVLGQMIKDGPGAVVFGPAETEKLQFYSTANTLRGDTPDAGKNLFTVENGTVQFTTKWGSDNLAITLRGDSRLVVGPENADATKALYLVGSSSSLASERPDGKIPLDVKIVDPSYTAVICTSTNPNLEFATSIPKGIRKSVRITKQTVSGAVTTYVYKAEVKTTGFMLLMR